MLNLVVLLLGSTCCWSQALSKLYWKISASRQDACARLWVRLLYMKLVNANTNVCKIWKFRCIEDSCFAPFSGPKRDNFDKRTSRCAYYKSTSVYTHTHTHTHTCSFKVRQLKKLACCTECFRWNLRYFGRTFLMLNYIHIIKNTCIWSRTLTDIMTRDKWGLLVVPRTVPV